MGKKPAKRFWVGSPDGFGEPDDGVEGLFIPDEQGDVYLKKPASQTPRRADCASTKDKAKQKKKS